MTRRDREALRNTLLVVAVTAIAVIDLFAYAGLKARVDEQQQGLEALVKVSSMIDMQHDVYTAKLLEELNVDPETL